MKSIQMEVKTTTNKKGAEVIITRKAELNARDVSFQAIAKFNKDVEKINKLLKTAIKTNAFTEFEIVTYEYDVDNKGYYSNMKMDTYRRWEFRGWAQDDNGEADNGVIYYYLLPDTRYTPANHDMVYEYTLESITA